MRLCILDNNSVCVNIITAASEDPRFLQEGNSYAPDHSGAIGWKYQSGSWIEPDAIPPDLDELAEKARVKRNSLLAQSDFVVILSYESGEPIPAEWSDYRKLLRDIPEQLEFPLNVVWPTKPNQN